MLAVKYSVAFLAQALVQNLMHIRFDDQDSLGRELRHFGKEIGDTLYKHPLSLRLLDVLPVHWSFAQINEEVAAVPKPIQEWRLVNPSAKVVAPSTKFNASIVCLKR